MPNQLGTDSNQYTSPLNPASTKAADPCVHCGFCLPSCASYRVLGTEMDSPRGRIHILKALSKGELKLDPTLTSHFDTCLGCFACVSACPSGVRYDELLENTRPLLNSRELRPKCQNLFRQLLLFLLPYPNRLRAVLQTMRGYSGSWFQHRLRRLRITALLGPQLEAMESLLPELDKKNFQDDFQILNVATGIKRGKVGLVLGCVQRCFDPNVNQATVKVLQANGFEVVIPKEQGCCGAVTHHQGHIKHTQQLAQALVKSFEGIIGPDKPGGTEPLEAILVAASGCGHTLKAYKHLLKTKDNFKVPVFDVHEYLYLKGLSETFLNKLTPLNHPNGQSSDSESPLTLAYHDACHMVHGQGIFKEPRQLLQSIPSLEIREVLEPGLCCGSAGIYNLIQPKEANQLGKMKANELVNTGGKIVASANIGCTLQLRNHLKDSLSVLHPMQLLAISAGLHQTPRPQ